MNTGDLKLKYRVIISGIDGDAKLNDAIEWTYSVNDGTTTETYDPTIEHTLEKNKDSGLITITGHMKEEAGNEYQNLSINGIGITVLAAQATGEFDSINDQYDVSAEYPIVMSTSVETGADNKTTSAVTVESVNTVSVGGIETPTAKVTIPEGVQLNAGTTKVDPTIEETTAPANFTASAGMDNRTFEITMPGVASNNDEPITVEFFIGKDLGNITLQHNGVRMNEVASAGAVIADQDYFYDNNTGFLTLMSATFSPFTVEYPTQSWSGSGDNTLEAVDGVYSIGTAAELAQFAYEVNVMGTTFAGETVKLTADIDLAGKNWAPVGPNADAPNKFRGTFDGNGKTISNLVVNNSAPDYQASGFFGALNGTAKNFTIDGATIIGLSEANSEGQTDNGIAVVAGSIYTSGSIEGVTVKNATVTGNRYVGGISGYTYGSVKNCTVENVTLTASCDTLTGSYDNGDKVGGIVGYFPEDSQNVVDGNKIKNVTITGYRDIGGIAGFATGPVTNSTVGGGVKLIVDASHNYKNYSTLDEFDAEAIVGDGTAGENNTGDVESITKQLTVSTAAQLSEALNATYNSDVTIKLANNIKLSGVAWPACNLQATNGSKVTIDGNGKTISGLSTTKAYVYGYDACGLIANVFGTVEIKNLTVTDATVTVPAGTNSLDAGGVIVGYFMPWPGKLTFTNCKVVNSTVNSNMYAAGLVGYVGGQPETEISVVVNNCEVSGCTFNGGDATGALIALNNHVTTINGATVKNNAINGGAGYSAAALVGTSIGGTTATGVTESGNTFVITGNNYQVNNRIYGYIYKNDITYSVNGSELVA